MTCNTLEAAATRLAIAKQAFVNQHGRVAMPGDLIRSKPGCERECPTCSLECAVIAASVRDAEHEYANALKTAGTVLTHGGRLYAQMKGRA